MRPYLLCMQMPLMIALLVGPARGTSLLVNGDFEAGNVGFTTQYLYSHHDLWAEGKYDVVDNPCHSHPWCTCFQDHTSGTGLMLVVNGAVVVPNLVVWSQTVPVTPSSSYTFSLWTANWSIEGAFNIPALEVQINGQAIATFSGVPVAGVWESRQAAWLSGAATSATITIIDRTVGYGGNDFAFDDMAFVPEGAVGVEPTTWSQVKATYR